MSFIYGSISTTTIGDAIEPLNPWFFSISTGTQSSSVAHRRQWVVMWSPDLTWVDEAGDAIARTSIAPWKSLNRRGADTKPMCSYEASPSSTTQRGWLVIGRNMHSQGSVYKAPFPDSTATSRCKLLDIFEQRCNLVKYYVSFLGRGSFSSSQPALSLYSPPASGSTELQSYHCRREGGADWSNLLKSQVTQKEDWVVPVFTSGTPWSWSTIMTKIMQKKAKHTHGVVIVWKMHNTYVFPCMSFYCSLREKRFLGHVLFFDPERFLVFLSNQ